MSVFKSKIIKELEAENKMLKDDLKEIDDKESKIDLLIETINKLKKDVTDFKNLKADYKISIEYLKSQEQQSKNTIETLNKEIAVLREIKSDEQNHLLNLTSHLNDLESSFTSSNTDDDQASKINNELLYEIREAEERKGILLEEENRLQNRISILNENISSLSTRESSLHTELQKKNAIINDEDKAKRDLLNTDIKNLEEKLNKLKNEERKSTGEIMSRINYLLNEEASVKERVDLRRSELDNLDEKINENELFDKKEQEDKTISLIIEEQTLVDSIEKKKKNINEMTASITLLNEEYENKIKDYQRNIDAFKSKETEIELRVAQKHEELNELGELKSENDDLKIMIAKLKDEQSQINESIRRLSLTEELKKDNLKELNDFISSKEIRSVAIDTEINDKGNKLNEINVRHKQANESINLKHKELLAVVRSIDDKSNILRNLSGEVSGQEEKIRRMKKEVELQENHKNEIFQKINAEKEFTFKLREEYKKLKQIIPLLEKKKAEMKLGNDALESRFTNMFQKYSKELNEIGSKKNVLDQIIHKKEKDINEQDQVLFEKLAALEESERVLNLRQTEIESFEEMLGTINEQKEMVIGDLHKLGESAIEKRNFNNELQIESNLLKNKIVEFEKGILNVFSGIENRYQQDYEKRMELENEVKSYEERLDSLNEKIKDSMNELFNLQNSLTQIKIEHEEHRGNITKLAAMKKKLTEEITRNQKLFDKYREVKQKLRNENNPIIIQDDSEEQVSTVEDNFRKYALPELTKVFKL
jgi:chromosome segregation ATPase